MALVSDNLLQRAVAFSHERWQRQLDTRGKVMPSVAPPLSSIMQFRWTPPQLDAEVITQHNSDVAALNPKEWHHHLLGLSRDVHREYEKALDFDSDVFHFARPNAEDIPGEKMFDEYRSTTYELATFETFQRRFELLTKGVLAGLTFQNAVVAGGIVLACLLHQAGNSDKYSGSDVEPTPAAVVDGYRSVQIVTTLYSNVAHVISLFDLGPVSVAYDGEEVWFSPRALWSISTAYTHMTDAIRGSSASRILKYSQRGFGLYFQDGESGNGIRHMIGKQADHVMANVVDMKVAFGVSKLQPHMFGHLLRWVEEGQEQQWTHSGIALARLATVWALACGNPEAEEAVIRNVHSSGALYGLYCDPTSMTSADEVEKNAEALSKMGLLPHAELHYGIAEKLGIAGGLVQHYPSLDEAISARMRVNVILPIGFCDAMNQVSPKSVKRIDPIATCTDEAGNAFELCVWIVSLNGDWITTSQGPATGLVRFLKKAAALTSWAIDTVDSGAPWKCIKYGKTLLSIMENDIDAAFIDADHFYKWLESKA
ncbi:hypothetical protein CF319_g5917 [Tilletia indica]|nr:hypothetical protein CF319_g5917 [Tilletia indica]